MFVWDQNVVLNHYNLNGEVIVMSIIISSIDNTHKNHGAEENERYKQEVQER